MYDLECLNSAWGPTKTSKGRQAPGMKGQTKTVGMETAQVNGDKEVEVGGKEDVLAF